MRKRIWRGGAAFGIVLCLVTVVFVVLGKNPFLRSPTEAELEGMLPGESRQIFEETGAFTLLSLGSEIDEDDRAYEKSFHGYDVVGKAQITNPRERNRVIAALYNGMAGSHLGAACFNPAHGLHVTQGRHSVDMVICFGCHHVLIYLDGKRTYDGTLGSEPLDEFNRALADAGIAVRS